MCYFNGIQVTYREYLRLTTLEATIKNMAMVSKAYHDGFTYSEYPIVRPVDGGKGITLDNAIWGYLPSITSLRTVEDIPTFRKRYLTLDAKGETILKSAFFAESARKRRCLIPSSGFYDWRHYKPEGAKKVEKYPYHVTLPDTEYFYMAGIWNPFKDKESGETFDTFAMITAPANSLMEQVHNERKRMPVIFEENLALEWIQDGLSDERIQELAVYQYPSERMRATTIHKTFKTSDSPTEPCAYQELPALVL